MLHGSGASYRVFSAQFESALPEHFRLIAIDLPGHGRSDDFSEPHIGYTLPALAETIAGLFPDLGFERASVFGWSLGGHIAMEMMARLPQRLSGVMIAGAPPIDSGPLGTLSAFHLNPTILLASRPVLSPSQAERIAHMCYGDRSDRELVDAILRTDPDFRPRAVRSLLRGPAANQRHTVQTCPVPLAVVHGTNDPAIRAGYLVSLAYANLWDRRVHFIPDGHHAPFMARPHTFNALLHRFATEVGISAPQPAGPALPQRVQA